MKNLKDELIGQSDENIKSLLQMQVEEVMAITALAEMVKPRVKKAQYDQWVSEMPFKLQFTLKHYWQIKPEVKKNRLKETIQYVQSLPVQGQPKGNDSAEDTGT